MRLAYVGPRNGILNGLLKHSGVLTSMRILNASVTTYKNIVRWKPNFTRFNPIRPV